MVDVATQGTNTANPDASSDAGNGADRSAHPAGWQQAVGDAIGTVRQAQADHTQQTNQQAEQLGQGVSGALHAADQAAQQVHDALPQPVRTVVDGATQARDAVAGGIGSLWHGLTGGVASLAHGADDLVHQAGHAVDDVAHLGVEATTGLVRRVAGDGAAQGFHGAAETTLHAGEQLAGFEYGVAKGLAKGVGGMVDGVANLAGGAYRFGTDASFREQVSGQVAAFSYRASQDPVGTAGALGSQALHAGGQWLDGAKQAASRGNLGEYVGDGVGQATAAIGSFFIPGAGEAEALSTAGRVGEVGEDLGLAGRLGEAAADGGRVADHLPSWLEHVNPTGSQTNCVSCTRAVDEALATGKPAAVAAEHDSVPFGDLEHAFGTRLSDAVPREQMEQGLLARGEGTRAVVYGSRPDGSYAHTWNAVVHDGRVRYLDGQSGADGVLNFEQFPTVRYGVTSEAPAATTTAKGAPVGDLAPAGVRGVQQTATSGRNTATWTIDAAGRPVHVEATLRETFPGAVRGRAELSAQESVTSRADALATDDAGHVIGHRFMLDQGARNMFPQDFNLNRGAYKTMENEWESWTRSGGEVRAKVDLIGGTPDRPARVRVRYDVVNPATGERVYTNRVTFENQGGESFDRIPRRAMAGMMR